jgi:hypothetical protein
MTAQEDFEAQFERLGVPVVQTMLAVGNLTQEQRPVATQWLSRKSLEERARNVASQASQMRTARSAKTAAWIAAIAAIIAAILAAIPILAMFK